MSRKILTRFACAALAATFVTAIEVPTADAQRRTLLEQWFPKAAERQKQRRLERLRRTNPGLYANENSAPIKKVSGPQYYTYKTETLATLSLAAALPALAVAKQSDVNALLGEDDFGIPSEKGIDLASTGAVEERPHQLNASALEGWSMKVEVGIANALKDHYSASPLYLWVNRDFKPNTAARDMLAVLERAHEFGLSPDDYAVGVPLIETVGIKGDEKAGAKFELALSAAVLRYGADARNGRINPNGISGYHDFPGYKREYTHVAKSVFGAVNPETALESLHPDNQSFASLISDLAELRAQIDEDTLEPVEPGTFFKPGQESAELSRVVALIERKASTDLKTKHAETFAAYEGGKLFDEPLVALVRDFQKENGLGADGIVGKNTIAKMSTASPKAKIAKIELAMERLRWHPNDLGNRHVFINQPAYQASYMVNGKPQLSMRAIVGKPTNQTYFFNDTIEIVEVNPYWNVPRSILINQKLGKIRENPGYLAANNFEVITAKGVTDPYSVDWYSGSPTGVSIRQKPGGGNALGDLKILFPNKHAIYMHDTPSRNLFNNSSRAYSSGCVRLHKPREMAAAVLGTSVDVVNSEIAQGKNKAIRVQNQIPVYVSYFTAWPDAAGKVRYYTDVYGRDKALSKAIKRTSDMRGATVISSS